jgi:hypothetical protein
VNRGGWSVNVLFDRGVDLRVGDFVQERRAFIADQRSDGGDGGLVGDGRELVHGISLPEGPRVHRAERRAKRNDPQEPLVIPAGRQTMEAIMADEIGPLSDKTPRDASKMGSNDYTSLYVGMAIVLIGLVIVLYWAGIL